MIGGGGPFNNEIITKSLIGRSHVLKNHPKIIKSNLIFCDSPFKVQGGKPAATSIIWSDVKNKYVDKLIL